MKIRNKKNKVDITRKQLSFISSRPITTVENWLNERTVMPEYVFNARQEIINLMIKLKKDIKEFENDRT